MVLSDPSTRYKVSYVLDSAGEQSGHRLNANCLALGKYSSKYENVPLTKALYSGGRDGLLFAWDLGHEYDGDYSVLSKIQAHSSWVNDIVVTPDSNVISCSSDLSVKLWNPSGQEPYSLTTIGEHNDYVKRLAIPKKSRSNIVVSGGLDKRIVVWDYHEAKQVLALEQAKNCSVIVGPASGIYSLAANQSVIVNGGPQKDVQLWDLRSGKRVMDLVGHTDNVRDILISDDGQALLTASSDATIKLWSLRAQRCIHSFTLHPDSVWSLYSEHPDLKTFYAGDRSGLISRTDLRRYNYSEVCVPVCKQEHPVIDLVARNSLIWSTGPMCSINVWDDPDPVHSSHASSRVSMQPSTHSRENSLSNRRSRSSALDLNTDFEPSSAMTTSHPRHSIDSMVSNIFTSVPIKVAPLKVIQGQPGLVKHTLLSNRRHVLTEDTKGNITLWDIVTCKRVKEYKPPVTMEDAINRHDTMETLPRWASVDTLLGVLSVTLDQRHFMDTEVYADETGVEITQFKDKESRINLGKWVLRNLFAGFMKKELELDMETRKSIYKDFKTRQSVPISLNPETFPRLPSPPMRPQVLQPMKSMSALPMQGRVRPPPLNLTEPARTYSQQNLTTSPLMSPLYEGKPLPFSPQSPIDGLSGPGLPQPTLDSVFSKHNSLSYDASTSTDYFSFSPPTPDSSQLEPQTPSTVKFRETSSPPKSKESFMRRLKSLGRSKSSRTSTASSPKNPPVQPSSPLQSAPLVSAPTSPVNKKVVDIVPKPEPRRILSAADLLKDIRKSYTLADMTKGIPNSKLVRLLPEETPPLDIDKNTLIIITGETAVAGCGKVIYQGHAGTLFEDAENLRKIMPAWLARLVLLNEMQPKQNSTVNFTVQPLPESGLPPVLNNTTRLNAGSLMRAKKIIDYGKERLQSQLDDVSDLILTCRGNEVPKNMTLATIRTRLWKSSGDVVLHYSLPENKTDDVEEERRSFETPFYDST
ncbi:WDR48 family WD repeat protein [Schizosaccharomyces japonicus yFS275]|uniref:WDR48 family WD repeat protein n=1 Tax=Schizosaccharomyces japonicus (strain yFS275 / FY16936) TaxID=402676 RepID=B6JWM7_SCHJY|nr:WDR48 family WD repeat protein [Schizosaccharomyces japonicus yFS275]EEB05778.1 WDR48 family WD repeat protein [Schizosaccharomyces japonicus yFS275]